ncbi:MAG: HicB family protein [Rhizobiales bacterium 65-9]|nr:MAG: HicB family protein [Rhizobiales bacterium 65-9]
MRHYVALIHKEPKSGYGVSFPDLPGVITVGETIDDAIAQAGDVLSFAAEDWEKQAGTAFPAPRTIDQLRADPDFVRESAEALLAVIPFSQSALPHAAE